MSLWNNRYRMSSFFLIKIAVCGYVKENIGMDMF